jgi:hypothetical protein
MWGFIRGKLGLSSIAILKARYNRTAQPTLNLGNPDRRPPKRRITQQIMAVCGLPFDSNSWAAKVGKPVDEEG